MSKMKKKKLKIKNKTNFWFGIVLLLLSLITSKVTGWTTEGYGITISFFGLYYSLIHLIGESLKYE